MTHRLLTPALTILLGVVSAGAAVASQQTDADALGQAAVAIPDLAFLGVGLLILGRRPRHRVGRLLVPGSLIAMVGTGLTEVSVRRLESAPDDVVARLGGTLGATGRGLGWLMIVLFLPLIFPDGVPEGPPRLARAAWHTCLAALAVYPLTSLLAPTISDLRVDRIDNPIGLPRSFSSATDGLAALLLLLGALGIVLGVASLVARFRQGTALRRQQLILLGLSFAGPIVVLALSMGDHGATWMFGAATLPIPIAVVVAIRQQRLYDVSLALNRSLTYGTLWLLIALVYAVVVGGVGATMRREGAAWLPWVAAGVVAVSFAPLRDALQRAANRITYGQWSAPAEVLTRTRRRLADATDVDGLLQSLITDLGEGLGMGYVDLVDTDGRVLAHHGEPVESLDREPLAAYGAVVGHLRWARRELRPVDRTLIADLAAQLGSVVHADGLLASVRAAQERLVLAREEERRRLRRDLHDGLGPALAGLTLQVDTVRNRLGDPDVGLLRLRDGIQETVLDVRRIVEGLRPAALDDLGLLESLRQLGPRTGLSVEVEGDEGVVLPAAVEVAAYRIAAEALANVAKHSGADRARVCVTTHGRSLVVRVADEGTGEVHPRPGGVGLTSMRERAEEIGGSLEVVGQDGTVVTARLPLGRTP